MLVYAVVVKPCKGTPQMHHCTADFSPPGCDAFLPDAGWTELPIPGGTTDDSNPFEATVVVVLATEELCTLVELVRTGHLGSE